jgi:nucleoside-diphosphate kinase
MRERTFAIIKPDAVEGCHVGEILSRVEREGFRIVALRLRQLTRREAEGFYAVHRERTFFGDLTAFMSSGPCVVLVLEAEGAIARWRAVMGATDPAKAAEGTVRRSFATNVERNAVHGSDAPETAAAEIAYFFPAVELA